MIIYYDVYIVATIIIINTKIKLYKQDNNGTKKNTSFEKNNKKRKT